MIDVMCCFPNDITSLSNAGKIFFLIIYKRIKIGTILLFYPDYPYDHEIAESQTWMYDSYFMIKYREDGRVIHETGYDKMDETNHFIKMYEKEFYYFDPAYDSNEREKIRSIITKHYFSFLGSTQLFIFRSHYDTYD